MAEKASSEGKQRASSSAAHLVQQVGRVLLLGALLLDTLCLGVLLLGALLLGVTVTCKGQSRRRGISCRERRALGEKKRTREEMRAQIGHHYGLRISLSSDCFQQGRATSHAVTV